MSLDKLKTEIRQLPYSDMKLLASQLADELESRGAGPGVTSTADDVAEALLALPISAEQPASLEDQYLRAVFKRKRAIAIVCEDKGWAVNIAGVNGAVGHDPNLREAINRLLDNVVGLKALE